MKLFIIILSLTFFLQPVFADRFKGQVRDGGNVTVQQEKYRKYKRQKASPPPKGYYLDKRHRHGRYYPKRGYVVNKLPNRHRIIRHRGHRYYYSSGIWYKSVSRHYRVIRPPIGVVVPVLPEFYTTITFGSVPYYYAGGIYYTWTPDRTAYIVSSPPKDSVESGPPISTDLFIYPKNKQSEEKQAQDRYECHRWSREQTGFDPTMIGGDVPSSAYSEKKDGYYRAMRACLEGRQYSVR